MRKEGGGGKSSNNDFSGNIEYSEEKHRGDLIPVENSLSHDIGEKRTESTPYRPIAATGLVLSPSSLVVSTPVSVFLLTRVHLVQQLGAKIQLSDLC